MLIAVTIITVISFSRLYLGAHWFSDVIAGLSLGLAWVALLGIAYTHHVHRETVPAKQLLLTVMATLTLAGGWHVNKHLDTDLVRYAYRPEFRTLTLENWQRQGWRSLPATRSEMDGDAEEPLSVQWVATAHTISTSLTAIGWQKPAAWNSKAILLWLLPSPPLQQLPVLPKFNHGTPQTLTFVKPVSPDTRMVLRMWPMPYQVTNSGHPAEPLWGGMITLEQLRHIRFLTFAKTSPDFITPVQSLTKALQSSALTKQSEVHDAKIILVW